MPRARRGNEFLLLAVRREAIQGQGAFPSPTSFLRFASSERPPSEFRFPHSAAEKAGNGFASPNAAADIEKQTAVAVLRGSLQVAAAGGATVPGDVACRLDCLAFSLSAFT